MESGELSLHKVVRLVEATEMGKTSQASVSKGSLSGLSDHQKGKEQGTQEKRATQGLTSWWRDARPPTGTKGLPYQPVRTWWRQLVWWTLGPKCV